MATVWYQNTNPALQPYTYYPAPQVDGYEKSYTPFDWADELPEKIVASRAMPMNARVRIHSALSGNLLGFGVCCATTPTCWVQVTSRLTNSGKVSRRMNKKKTCPNCSTKVPTDTDICPACAYAWSGCTCLEIEGDNADCPVHAKFPEVDEGLLWQRALEG